MGCLSPGVLWNPYLDSRRSLFIFRIIGFVMLLLCQCIFDNKNFNKTAFPLLFVHVLVVPSGGLLMFPQTPVDGSQHEHPDWASQHCAF